MRRPMTGIVRKYLQFCIVGGSGLVVDMAIFWTLHSQIGMSIPSSKIAAAEIALLNNFTLNECWTFRQVGSRNSRWARLLRFHAICVVGIGLSLAILLILNQQFAWSAGLANGAAIVLVSLWNFVLSWVWGWRAPSDPTDNDGLPRSDTM